MLKLFAELPFPHAAKNQERAAILDNPNHLDARSVGHQLRLQTPHFPPCFAQYWQYLQFLHAWQGSEPVQVTAKRLFAPASAVSATIRDKKKIASGRLRIIEPSPVSP